MKEKRIRHSILYVECEHRQVSVHSSSKYEGVVGETIPIGPISGASVGMIRRLVAWCMPPVGQFLGKASDLELLVGPAIQQFLIRTGQEGSNLAKTAKIGVPIPLSVAITANCLALGDNHGAGSGKNR
jgi:hypothetical protein